MLYATVRNRKIHVKKPDTVVQNGVKVDWLQLEMDDEWAEMESIVCVFVARYTEEQTDDGGTKSLVEREITKEMLHTFGKKVLVPWECLEHSGMLSVSCTGYVGSEKIMTTMYPDSFWEIVQNGPKSGDSTIEPTASLYDQIVAAAGTANAAAIAATQAREQLLQDKANGVFDGADGQAATVEVGTVITGSPEENAQVYATGTPQEVRLNFVLPRGKQGQKGEIGEQGRQGEPGKPGEKGDKGDPGVYVGSGDMPDGYSVQIDPDGDADRLVADISRGTDGTWEITYTDGTVETISDAGYQAIKVDTTLTKPGEAADAKATGDAISSLSGKIDNIPSGKDGADGQDGITPTIGDNGNWYLGSTDTGKPSRGEAGPAGADGKDGAPGAAGTDGYTPVKGTDYFTEADKQEIAEAAAGMVSIPDALPNPNALTFTGAVTGTYDGSKTVTVNIPSGGGSGGSGGVSAVNGVGPDANGNVYAESNYKEMVTLVSDTLTEETAGLKLYEYDIDGLDMNDLLLLNVLFPNSYSATIYIRDQSGNKLTNEFPNSVKGILVGLKMMNGRYLHAASYQSNIAARADLPLSLFFGQLNGASGFERPKVSGSITRLSITFSTALESGTVIKIMRM